MRVAYLSHPIGPSEELPARGDNLENAIAWLRFLVRNTRWAFLCPWLAYMTAVGDELHGPRALKDQITLLERCDLVIQVGGWTSPHMLIEANHARRMSLPIVDLTDLGSRPYHEELCQRHLSERGLAAASAVPRRAWIPPLLENDVAALRTAEELLGDDSASEAARIVIQRIVSAAMRR